ncbi:LuxR family transcriptional regulator [Longispora sp. K20-0274]|uniref:AAA family ATPase n=1 Tax=Longispora sp. K20-0274 TaxID=3088255 RepID=UPI00399AF123
MTALPMAGRGEELAAILGAWKQVGDQSQIVVLTGEAGAGKSRLVAEALAALRPRPTRVLAGQARSHAPSPYDWTASALSGHPVEDLPGPPDALAWLTQRPDARREFSPGMLLRVAVDVTRAVLGDGPGVLVVEDLHDLDPASLALVAELAATPLPALVIVTSRAPDALAGRVLARLGGTPRTVRRHLGPLSVEEVGDVLEAAFGTRVGAPAAHERTGGNAFWLTELVAAFRSAGPDALGDAPLPAHLASMVTDRLAGEAPAVVRLAHAAALLGGAAALAPGPRDEPADDPAGGTDAAVHRLVSLGLLVLGPDGEPGFRYPLMREAVADSVLPAERAALLARAGGPEPHLTGREREVLHCVAAGMTNQQAATSLGISIRTVTVHVSNLLRKTGSASRTEAALWAVRNGYTE